MTLVKFGRRSEKDSRPRSASAVWRSTFTRRLLSWFRGNSRPLPWRRDRDPYRVWVSEVMLQQTQVATVVPYFERFLAAFPTIGALAAADEDEVLKLWEGLGYYRRARQLHRAARMVHDDHAGRFPRDETSVRRLPGVGRYTAAAVLSIAFDERLPILEGNTQRLYSRLMAFRGATDETAGQRRLWSFAESILPVRNCGAFNQALMELGATICTPKSPRCDVCPVAALCPTHRRGLAAVIPAPRRRPRVEQVAEALVVVRRRGKVLLMRHAEGQRWGGLWDFVRFPLSGAALDDPAREIRPEVARRTGLTLGRCLPLTIIKHTVTRFRITLACYEITAISGRVRRDGAVEMAWVSEGELRGYALNATARRLAGLIAAGGKCGRRWAAHSPSPPKTIVPPRW